MCDWIILLYSRKLTEHCKPAIMEKIKISIKKKYFFFFFGHNHSIPKFLGQESNLRAGVTYTKAGATSNPHPLCQDRDRTCAPAETTRIFNLPHHRGDFY